MFTKTRRECIPVGSHAASLLLTVLVNISAPCTKPSHMALGVAECSMASHAQPWDNVSVIRSVEKSCKTPALKRRPQ